MINWNSDQLALRNGLAAWSARLSENHVERDAEGGFSHEKWDLVRECGILRLPFGEQWGGLGQDLLTTMYLLEALGHGCRDGGLNFAISTHLVSTGIPLQRFGSASLKDRYLPAVCDGSRIGAHAITEPGSGSDALAMSTRAVRDGDDFVLTGSKTFVSNGPVADLFVVYARTHPDGGPLGTTAFLVERGTPGFAVGNPIPKMGLRTAPLAELYFDECRIPATNVVGRAGGGFLVLDFVMKWEILCSFVINLGEMEHRLERCVGYAGERTAFGSPIGSYQAVSHRIADMKIGVETTRKWLYDTAVKVTRGESVTTDMAITKLIASEQNVASAMAAVQIFGGNGYMAEYGLEKDLRNAVAGTIYSGTSEIQRNRIAAMLGLK
ncbi:Acyl-CoA dehydrogenase, N-terminal domain [Lentzea albidocapillata subsp. violacea]|uniref:Acyl-CoA dehydrogenase, N-terminal domain n=1 Tax=Lentzea albidocapillata subsp. violacea TaxID=128104 RepID=A0A1G8TP63_9PSEU|nr:acyl-CoA dehydrogenase family protein [Lentzea albidocapillata]SDJ43193.1 Acyl-CoA dehydrogenase, N-terminal domain [Lentzea albidocapillata subsp. violacea]